MKKVCFFKKWKFSTEVDVTNPYKKNTVLAKINNHSFERGGNGLSFDVYHFVLTYKDLELWLCKVKVFLFLQEKGVFVFELTKVVRRDKVRNFQGRW